MITRHVEDTIDPDGQVQWYDQGGGVLDVYVERPTLKSELFHFRTTGR